MPRSFLHTPYSLLLLTVINHNPTLHEDSAHIRVQSRFQTYHFCEKEKRNNKVKYTVFYKQRIYKHELRFLIN